MSDHTTIMEILQKVKALSKDYYTLTGKPLGATGEIAEFEAARILELTLAPARQAGYDAIEGLPGGEFKKIQIKGRCLPRKYGPGQRVGSIDIGNLDWDTAMLVLLDNENMEAFEIWEAPRDKVEGEIHRPGSKARTERHSLAINQFKRAGRLRWPSPS